MLSFTAVRSCKQRGSDRLGRGQGGGVIGNDGTNHPRPASVAVALDFRQTTHRLNHRVVGALSGIRTTFPKPANRYIYDVAPNTSDIIFSETYPLRCARTEVVYQGVRCRYELTNDHETFSGLEIDSYRAFVSVAREKGSRYLVAPVCEMTHQVTAGRLDLDNVSALICQHHRGDRSRDHRR